MKRAAIFALALLALAAPARADLRYTAHTVVHKIDSAPAAANAAFDRVAEVLVSTMFPGGAIDTTTLMGEKGQRYEYGAAMPGLPLGSVGLQRTDGTFVLSPRDKTYWKLPVVPRPAMPLPAGVKADATYTRTGEFATIAGVRAERIAMKMTMSVPSGTGVQVSIEMTGDVWLTDQFARYQSTSAANDQLASLLYDSKRPNGFVMRATIRGGILGHYEVDRAITTIAEVPSRPELLEIASDYKEVPMPSASTISAEMAAFPTPSQPPRALFNGATLSGMVIDHTSADVAPGGVLAVHGEPGWVHTDRAYGDYTLSFDARLGDAATALDLYVRTWPTLTSGTPNNGYRLHLSDPIGTGGETGHLRGVGQTATERLFNATALGEAMGEPARWHHYEVTLAGGNARLVIDKRTVMTASGVGNAQGVIALRPLSGTTEFRSIAIAPLPSTLKPPPGILVAGAPGVQLPRVVHQEKPEYHAGRHARADPGNGARRGRRRRGRHGRKRVDRAIARRAGGPRRAGDRVCQGVDVRARDEGRRAGPRHDRCRRGVPDSVGPASYCWVVDAPETGAGRKVGPPPVNRLAPMTIVNQPTIITIAFSESQTNPDFREKMRLMLPRSAKIRSMPLAAGYEQI